MLDTSEKRHMKIIYNFVAEFYSASRQFYCDIFIGTLNILSINLDSDYKNQGGALHLGLGSL